MNDDFKIKLMNIEDINILKAEKQPTSGWCIKIEDEE